MTESRRPLVPPRLEPLGDGALALVMGEGIDAQVNARAHQLAGAIRHWQLPGILDVVPGYAEVTVHYDPLAQRYSELCQLLQKRWPEVAETPVPEPRAVDLPVYYGGARGPDLAGVAEHCGMSPAQVVARHAAGCYRVYLLGFLPGFAYLGGLDPALATPRLAAPRLRVAAGSVAIGGHQTGVYPLASPGGWRVIGWTPQRLFQPDREEPCILQPGDLVRFVPQAGPAPEPEAGAP